MRREPSKKPARQPLNQLLRSASQHVGTSGRRVLKFVADNRELVLASSAAELGARTGTSDATVVRTVQTLGFAGLSELRRAILESLVPASTPADDMRRTLADLEKSTGAALDSVLQTHADSMKVLGSDACRAQIAAATHALDGSQRIVVFGIGPSAALASYASMLLVRGGRRSRSLNVSGSMLADQLLDLHRGDALLILAYGRLYKEVGAVFKEARSLGLPTILMTEQLGTALAKKADVVIGIPRGRPGNIALHGATLVGLEALVLSLAAARPDDVLLSLDRLNDLREIIAGSAKAGARWKACGPARRRLT
jgi:DNA-binding MurR/RpiR family transcriptional regulator